jgi:hypothetical protein
MTAEMAEVNELRNIAVHGLWAPKLALTMALGELFDFDSKDHLIATTPRDKKRKLPRIASAKLLPVGVVASAEMSPAIAPATMASPLPRRGLWAPR